MLDPKVLRAELDTAKDNLLRRGFVFDIESYKLLDEERKAIQIKTQELQNKRNTGSKLIGQAKAKGEDIEPLLAEVASIGVELDLAKKNEAAIIEKLNAIHLSLPNLLDASVPEGNSEDDNVEVRKWGKPRSFDFEPKDHVEIGEGCRVQTGRLQFVASC